MYPLIIIPRPGNLWYIGFKDEETSRLLPRKKKFLRRWSPQSCPIAGISQEKEVFYFESCEENELTPDNILEVFTSMYHSVEDYLIRVNSGEVPNTLHYREALWTFRNIKGQCGQCNTPFSSAHRDAGGGMCSYCWGHSY